MISKLLQDFKEIQMDWNPNGLKEIQMANSQRDGTAYSTYLLGFSTSLEKQLWQAG